MSVNRDVHESAPTGPLRPAVTAARASTTAVTMLPPGAAPAGPTAAPATAEARRSARCAQCGYDLRGTRSSGGHRCPECGHTLDDIDSRRTREHAFFRRFGVIVTVGAVLTVGAVTVMVVALGDRAALFAIPLVLFLFCWLPFVLLARLTRDIE